MPKIKVNMTLETPDLIETFTDAINDPETMTEVHNTLFRYCDPYVPMRVGNLAQTVDITSECVWYKSPYAHYMYEGIVYGPNIPIYEGEGEAKVIVGYYSIPGRKKQPTGKDIVYNHDQHPLADSHWDKRMMEDRGDEFTKEVSDIILRRMRNG